MSPNHEDPADLDSTPEEIEASERGQPITFTHRHANKIFGNTLKLVQLERDQASTKSEVRKLTATVNRMIGALILASVVIPMLTALAVKALLTTRP